VIFFDPKYLYGGESKLNKERERVRSRSKDYSSLSGKNESKSKSIPKNANAGVQQSRVDFEYNKKYAEIKDPEWASTKEFFQHQNQNNENY